MKHSAVAFQSGSWLPGVTFLTVAPLGRFRFACMAVCARNHRLSSRVLPELGRPSENPYLGCFSVPSPGMFGAVDGTNAERSLGGSLLFLMSSGRVHPPVHAVKAPVRPSCSRSSTLVLTSKRHDQQRNIGVYFPVLHRSQATTFISLLFVFTENHQRSIFVHPPRLAIKCTTNARRSIQLESGNDTSGFAIGASTTAC